MAHFQIDLHAHTTASDGTHPPAQLVARAAGRGVRVLGIADHDTLDGIAGAQAAGRQLGVKIVPGIELSTRHERDKQFVGIHLLGYFIDPTSPALVEVLNKVKQGRFDQKIQQIKKLQSFGFDIPVEAVLARASGVPGRPHIAAELLARNPGRFKDMGQIFDEYLGAGKKAHVARPFGLTVAQAIGVVKEAGGLPVLAHPAAYDGGVDPETVVRNAKAEGVLGIEVYYPYETGRGAGAEGSRWIGRLEQLARELGLLATGGTDFHGRPGDTVDLGDMGLTPEQFSRLQTGRQKLR